MLVVTLLLVAMVLVVAAVCGGGVYCLADIGGHGVGFSYTGAPGCWCGGDASSCCAAPGVDFVCDSSGGVLADCGVDVDCCCRCARDCCDGGAGGGVDGRGNGVCCSCSAGNWYWFWYWLLLCWRRFGW